jgi:hypothetical protein
VVAPVVAVAEKRATAATERRTFFLLRALSFVRFFAPSCGCSLFDH